MPNLRDKTQTTTTPAQTADAQFWEDHLIDDASYEELQGIIDGGLPASRAEYDNASSGLSATNVQDAIDEVASKDVTAITNAQIDALFV